jgi:ERCC4-type nuclease
MKEMLAELARREKEANIMPDPDIDIFMKVSRNLFMSKKKKKKKSRNLLSLEISYNIKGVSCVSPRVSP